MAKEYVRFDEIEDVLSSLDLLALVIPLAKKRPTFWKWIIIAAHSGLQSAMVCVLAGTSGVPVLDNKSARKMLKWFETREGRIPEERLADFNTLLERCHKGNYTDGAPLKLDAHQAKDIKRLHNHFRNNFAHFTPKSWSIEKAGLPRIVGAAVDCIETLMGHSRVLYKLSGNRKRRLAVQLKNIRVGLS